MLKSATEADLRVVASWIRTPEECWFWAGGTVRFPICLDTVATEIRLSPQTSFVLDDLIAFGQLFDKGNGLAHLARIIVAPHERGAGRGYALVDELVHTAAARGFERIGLNVQSDNPAAIALYTGIGFKVTPRPAALGAAAGAEYMCRDTRIGGLKLQR